MTGPEPHWLGRLAVDEAHLRQIREHGGAYGIRDEAGLEAALAGPRNRWFYAPESRPADIATACAFGIVRNHPYVDGNKRTGLVVLVAFLDRNGADLQATNVEAAAIFEELAAGEIGEGELADWVDGHLEVQHYRS